MTKVRLTLDEAYERAPVFLRTTERLEGAPSREQLIAWIEQPEVGYDRSDLVELCRHLWCILCNRTESGSGPAAVIHRIMDTEVGWMRGPAALYELQKEGLGRHADRRAELNRRVYNPTAVEKWDEVPAAVNT